MNQEVMLMPKPLLLCPTRKVRSKLVDVVEVSATKGDWTVPAFQELTLAMNLSDIHWRDVRRQREEFSKAGTVSICSLHETRTLEMRDDSGFAVVLLHRDVLGQARQENGQPEEAELKECDVVPDPTLGGLMTVLVREKRQGFQSGLFFLDGVATALASYLVRHYSTNPPIEKRSASGMAPSMLRRCIDFMEAHSEGDLRLSELAREVKLSTTHLIRSFRESTGKTPYQFLLHRRVEREKKCKRRVTTIFKCEE